MGPKLGVYGLLTPTFFQGDAFPTISHAKRLTVLFLQGVSLDLAMAKMLARVCLCVFHTTRFYQNDASWQHGIFTFSSAKDSATRICKSFPEIRTG